MPERNGSAKSTHLGLHPGISGLEILCFTNWAKFHTAAIRLRDGGDACLSNATVTIASSGSRCDVIRTTAAQAGRARIVFGSRGGMKSDATTVQASFFHAVFETQIQTAKS